MSLPNIILAMVNQQPITGYDIVKKINTHYPDVWQASHQQMYRELKRLEVHGLIESRVQPQTEKPDKVIYTITFKGVEAVNDWFRTEIPKLNIIRDEFAIKIAMADPEDIEGILNQCKELHSLVMHKIGECSVLGESSLMVQDPFERMKLRLAHGRAKSHWDAYHYWLIGVIDSLQEYRREQLR